MERITIIGMSPVGVSIGLALKKAKFNNTEIIGSSGDRQALAAAKKVGAMDNDISNLGAAVRGAQLIIMDLPFVQMREVMEAIAPIVEDDCVITDTGTTKVRVMEWAESFLPDSVSFVGGHPLIKKSPLTLDDASETLLQQVDYCLMPGHQADETSVKTIVGLVELLGARPLFLDPHEHDSYSAAMDVLPMVLSSALVTTASGSESWREMHRLAAGHFAEHSRLASSDPVDSEAACLANPDALVHWLDQYITELYSYRNMIKENGDELINAFVKAWEERAKWEAGVVVREPESNLPSAGESMASAMFGEKLMSRIRQVTGSDKEKKQPWKYNRDE